MCYAHLSSESACKCVRECVFLKEDASGRER